MRRYYPALVCALIMLPACAGPRRGAPSRPIEKVITHQVREGETWRSIARDFYRDEGRTGELAAFNGAHAGRPPAVGAGVRVPLSRADLKLLERTLDAVTAYNYGIELASAGDFGEAVEQFQRAIEVDPNMLDASFNLAVTYQKLGLHMKAIPVLRDLTTRSPRLPAYHFALGYSCFHAGNFAAARNEFVRTLEIDPTHRRALFSLAVVHERRGERDEALRRWNEYLELHPEGEWAAEARERRGALLDSSRQ